MSGAALKTKNCTAPLQKGRGNSRALFTQRGVLFSGKAPCTHLPRAVVHVLQSTGGQVSAGQRSRRAKDGCMNTPKACSHNEDCCSMARREVFLWREYTLTVFDRNKNAFQRSQRAKRPLCEQAFNASWAGNDMFIASPEILQEEAWFCFYSKSHATLMQFL